MIFFSEIGNLEKNIHDQYFDIEIYPFLCKFSRKLLITLSNVLMTQQQTLTFKTTIVNFCLNRFLPFYPLFSLKRKDGIMAYG